MSYIIKWTPRTLRFLRKLPKATALRLWTKVESIRDDPFRFLEHFEGDDFYKLRVGSYRALLDVDVTKKLIRVEVVDKRSKIYKR